MKNQLSLLRTFNKSVVRCKFLSVAYVLQNESDPEISLEHKNFDLTFIQLIILKQATLTCSLILQISQNRSALEPQSVFQD